MAKIAKAMTSQYKLGDHAARIKNLEKTVTQRFDDLEQKIDAIIVHQAERTGEIRVLKWISGAALSMVGALTVAFVKTKGWFS